MVGGQQAHSTVLLRNLFRGNLDKAAAPFNLHGYPALNLCICELLHMANLEPLECWKLAGLLACSLKAAYLLANRTNRQD